jgi:hypothetical protein
MKKRYRNMREKAENKFRCVKGYKEIPKLIAPLQL